MALNAIKITQSITRRGDGCQEYLDSIARLPRLTADEEVEIALKMKSENPKIAEHARQTLINANLRFVFSVAKQYQGNSTSLMDLVQEGNIGLCRAADAFDATKGFKFISYAVWWIRQSIMQYLSEHSKKIRMPVNKVNMLSRISQVKTKYFALHGIDADEYVIADETGIDIKDVIKVLNEAQSQNVSSLDAPVTDDSDTSMENLLVVDSPYKNPDSNLETESLQIEVRDFVKTLSDREQYVLNHVFGMDGCDVLSRTEIAEDLQLTNERIRQLEANAKRKLKNKFGDKMKSLF